MLNLLISLVALLHLGFLILEMFLWTTAKVAANFNLSLEQAHLMAPLAANMGLYNGFLAVGLIWAWFIKRVDQSVCKLFLLFIVIAGVYAAITIKLSILFVQALPAAIALLQLVLRPQAEQTPSGYHP
ncbi:DUF1304 domain-containing protein [Leptolyngbya sp. NIES-2104]|uniref:DUF1304 domain-containing protein n=1 Tax=Leptolyngbya sp. NIES-2104 TaxID=1552121 RepID=UPI00192CF350|nr:DUF1304 domain-containing protein [Leptolyngbya sp. NIES-2104]